MKLYFKIKKNMKITLIIVGSLSIISFFIASYLTSNKNDATIWDTIFKEPYYALINIIKRDNQIDFSLDEKVKLENTMLKKEIEQLKNILDVRSTIIDFEPVIATVISRKNFEWYDSLLINKGSNAGLYEGMAVINNQGLIGKLSSVTKHTSEIKLLTNNLKVSVSIGLDDKINYGVLTSYNSKNNIFFIEGITDLINIERGDLVMTTGLSEIFSKGIMIGKVKSISYDSFGLSQILEVEPSVDYDNISFVSVLKEKE